MGKKKIKNSLQLLAAIENFAGIRNAFIITKKDLAKICNLKTWSPQLEEKLNDLINNNRIATKSLGRQAGYRIELTKKLTPEEMSDLAIQDDIDGELLLSQINTNSDECEILNKEIEDISSTDDIEEIFNEFKSSTEKLVTKCKDYHEENIRLKMLVENLKMRERKWQEQAVLYSRHLNFK